MTPRYAYLGPYQQELAEILDNMRPTTLVAIMEDMDEAVTQDHATPNDSLLLNLAWHALARNVGDEEAHKLTNHIFVKVESNEGSPRQFYLSA